MRKNGLAEIVMSVILGLMVALTPRYALADFEFEPQRISDSITEEIINNIEGERDLKAQRLSLKIMNRMKSKDLNLLKIFPYESPYGQLFTVRVYDSDNNQVPDIVTYTLVRRQKDGIIRASEHPGIYGINLDGDGQIRSNDGEFLFDFKENGLNGDEKMLEGDNLVISLDREISI